MALNILVVDDSVIMRRMLIRTLGLCGVPIAAITEATNGQEGLDALAKATYDLVLVDINMPVMDGDQMVKAMRCKPEWAKLPVIYVSSESSTTRIEMLIASGAGFVHKPFMPEILRETIVGLVGVDGK
jgi:two-component system chemotaxis response regulator CheY